MRFEPGPHLLDLQPLHRLQIVALDEEVERSIHRRLGLAHRQARLVAQGRITRGVDEAIRHHAQGSEAGREIDVPNPPALESHIGEYRADNRLHSGALDPLLHPAPEPDLVVLERDGGTMHPQERALRRQVLDQIVRDQVSDLVSVGPVCVQTDERADDRSDGLAAERRRAIDDDNLATELRGLQRCGDAGDSGTEDADVGLDRGYGARAAAENGPRRDEFRCQFRPRS